MTHLGGGLAPPWLFWGVVMKPAPVLGTQRLIGPSEEATLFLGTIQKQAIGVLGGMALLQRGGLTAKHCKQVHMSSTSA